MPETEVFTRDAPSGRGKKRAQIRGPFKIYAKVDDKFAQLISEDNQIWTKAYDDIALRTIEGKAPKLKDFTDNPIREPPLKRTKKSKTMEDEDQAEDD